jgi:hypothetical protein
MSGDYFKLSTGAKIDGEPEFAFRFLTSKMCHQTKTAVAGEENPSMIVVNHVGSSGVISLEGPR